MNVTGLSQQVLSRVSWIWVEKSLFWKPSCLKVSLNFSKKSYIMDNIMRLLKQLLYADVIKTENLPLSQYYAFSYEFN